MAYVCSAMLFGGGDNSSAFLSSLTDTCNALVNLTL